MDHISVIVHLTLSGGSQQGFPLNPTDSPSSTPWISNRLESLIYSRALHFYLSFKFKTEWRSQSITLNSHYSLATWMSQLTCSMVITKVLVSPQICSSASTAIYQTALQKTPIEVIFIYLSSTLCKSSRVLSP